VRWRLRELPQRVTSLVTFLLIGAVCLVVLLLGRAALDPSNSLREALSHPLIVGILLIVVPALLSRIHHLKRSFRIPVLVPSQRRRVILGDDLRRATQLGDGVTPVPDGWAFKGDGQFSISVVTFRTAVELPLSVSAEFKPRASCWRAGFTLLVRNQRRLQVHLDSENRLVVYVNGRLLVVVKVLDRLKNRWNLLALEVASYDNATEPVVFCHLNDQSYSFGRVAVDLANSELRIEVWSDEQKNHHVTVRAVALS